MTCERSLEFENNLCICFADFENASDRVNWEKMMKVLQRLGVDWRDQRMISELYESRSSSKNCRWRIRFGYHRKRS